METVTDIAAIVGLVRDVVLLVLLTVALVALFIVFGKLRQLLNTVNSTADTIQETVTMVSEKVAEPAASNMGTAKRLEELRDSLLEYSASEKKTKTARTRRCEMAKNGIGGEDSS